MADTFPAEAPVPGTYTLDPERTTIHADVKAMFGLMTVHGTFRLQSGQVSIGADPGASSVRAGLSPAARCPAGRTERAYGACPGHRDFRGTPGSGGAASGTPG